MQQYCWQSFSTTMQNILSTGGSNSIIAVLGIFAPQPKLSHMIHYMLKMTFCSLSLSVLKYRYNETVIQPCNLEPFHLLLSEFLPVHSLSLLGGQPLFPVVLKSKQLFLLLGPHPGNGRLVLACVGNEQGVIGKGCHNNLFHEHSPQG